MPFVEIKRIQVQKAACLMTMLSSEAGFLCAAAKGRKKPIRPQEDKGSGAQEGKIGGIYPGKVNRQGIGRQNRSNIPKGSEEAGYRKAKRVEYTQGK